MCRISGIISPNLTNDSLKSNITTMMELQKHGGPDGEGIYIETETGLAFGHRRLSLLDLSILGNQPMSSSNQKYTIIFNGEIYNFLSLRKDLEELGHVFNSHSDTEVILNAYIAWGSKSFQKLRGMFALAIFDKVKNKVILVRDSQGVKPLYYYQQKDTFIFASEVKAFKNLPIKLTSHSDWQTYFLSFGHIPEPITTYSEIVMLPKGHYIEFDITSKSLSQAIYYVQENTFGDLSGISITDAQELVDSILDKAIQQQLVADAPIGVFLSGGIDSSLLALQTAKYQQNNLITVSLHFPEAQFSEKRFQQIISNSLAGQHISQEITYKDFESHFDQIITHMDQPGVDGINSWFVSKAAHDTGLKAVLSGIGADELFGGYPSFKRISQVPVARLFHPLINILANIKENDALQRIAYLAGGNHTVYEYLFLRGFFNPKQLIHEFGINKKQLKQSLDRLQEPYEKIPSTYNGKRSSWYERHYFMQNQLLKDADTMSMQHGVEIRVPFLDEDLNSLVKQLPSDILYHKGKPSKHLLINAFNGVLPKEIWNRPKMGFTFPFQQWIKKHPLYLQLKEKHLSPSKQTLFEHYEKDKIHWSKIMSLIVLDKFDA